MNLTKKQWMRSVLCSCAFLAAVCQQSLRLFFHFEDKDRHFMWFAQWEHTNLESLMVEELQHCQRSEVFGHGVLWRRAIWITFPLTLVNFSPKGTQQNAETQHFCNLRFFQISQLDPSGNFHVVSFSSWWFVWFEVEASLISSKRWNDLNVQVGVEMIDSECFFAKESPAWQQKTIAHVIWQSANSTQKMIALNWSHFMNVFWKWTSYRMCISLSYLT